MSASSQLPSLLVDGVIAAAAKAARQGAASYWMARPGVLDSPAPALDRHGEGL